MIRSGTVSRSALCVMGGLGPGRECPCSDTVRAWTTLPSARWQVGPAHSEKAELGLPTGCDSLLPTGGWALRLCETGMLKRYG